MEETISFQESTFQKLWKHWKETQNSFTTLVRTSAFVLAPRTIDCLQKKRYISTSSQEEGVAQGSLLAQLLTDMLEPSLKPQALLRKTNKRDSLSWSAPMEEGDHSLWESPADKVNGEDVAQVSER